MSAPVEPLLRLDDYAGGDMPDAEAASLEEQLFTAAADGDPPADMKAPSGMAGLAGLAAEAAFLDRLTGMSIAARTAGTFANGATRAQVDALLASPIPVHYVDLGTGGEKVFTPWDPGVRIVIARVGVDLRGWQDVDIEVTAADGTPVKTFRDVLYAPEDGAVYAVCHEPLARLAFASGRSVSRVVATRDGKRETVAVYDVRPPGP